MNTERPELPPKLLACCFCYAVTVFSLSIWGIAWSSLTIQDFSIVETWYEAKCSVLQSNNLQTVYLPKLVITSNELPECVEKFVEFNPLPSVGDILPCLSDGHTYCTAKFNTLHEVNKLIVGAIVALVFSILAFCSSCNSMLKMGEYQLSKGERISSLPR